MNHLKKGKMCLFMHIFSDKVTVFKTLNCVDYSIFAQIIQVSAYESVSRIIMVDKKNTILLAQKYNHWSSNNQQQKIKIIN